MGEPTALTAALLGAGLALSLALIRAETAPVLVGAGTFTAYFLVVFTLTGTLLPAVMAASFLSFWLSRIYMRLLAQDLYAAVLLLTLALLGVVLLFLLVAALWETFSLPLPASPLPFPNTDSYLEQLIDMLSHI